MTSPDEKPQAPPAAAEATFGFWTQRAFRSHKTPDPILAETRLHEDYLSIASLDEEVREIRAATTEADGFDPEFRPDFLVSGGDGATHLVRVVPHDADAETRQALLEVAEGAASKGVAYRIVDEAWVSREPRLRNARLVHGCRRMKVTPGDRVRILNFLNENGQSTLIEAAASVTGSPDGVECVLALVAEGNVMVDLNVTLAPEMPVWRLRVDWDADR